MSRAFLAALAALGLTAGCGKSNAVSQSRPQAAPTQQQEQPPPAASATAPDPACGSACPPVQPGDQGPRVDFTEPLSGEQVKGKLLRVRGTASDDAPGVEVQVSLDGHAWTPAPVSQGAFEVTLPLPALDGDFLTIHARATDSAGHSLLALQQVQVDNLAPQVTVDALTPAAAAAWLSGRLLGGGATDGSGVVALEADRGDGQGLLPAAYASGRWALTWVAAPDEDDVAHALVVEARDAFGNIGRARVDFRIDVVPPRLRITSPADGARFNAQALAVGAGAVPIAFQVADGDPAAFVREAGSNARLSSLEVVTDPADDGKTYAVKLEAVDGAGNTTTAQVQFAVDRRAPTAVRVAPPDGSVATARVAELEFSEPMDASGPAIEAFPPVSGTWSADRRTYRTAQLAADTAYTFTALPLADDFGNQLPPLPRWRARTPPQAPASGTVIATSVTDFSAAADEDGVLTVVARQGGVASIFLADPVTGAIASTHAVSATAGAQLLAGAHRVTDASGLPVRLASARVGGGLLPLSLWWKSGVAQPLAPASAFVHTRGFEAPGAGLIGTVSSNSIYQRPLAPNVALSVRPDHLAGVDGRWEVVELLSTGFIRQSFSCEPSSPTGPVVCAASPPFTQTGFGAQPRYSHAVTRRCSFHAYDDAAGNRVLWTEPFVASCRLGSCPQAFATQDSAASELQLGAYSASSVLAASRTALGIGVVELVPDASCRTVFGAGAVLAATGVASFRPVRVGDKPGLIWLDTQGTLRVFAP